MTKFVCALLVAVFLPACLTETSEPEPADAAVTDAATDASEPTDASPEPSADAAPADAGVDGCAPPCVTDTFEIAGRGLATVCHCP